MPRDQLHNSKSPVSRCVEMQGFFPDSMVEELLERIGRMVPDWSFDVRPHGTWGSGVLIRIRLWNGTHAEEIDVNPSHYTNHPDPEARENPILAALIDGINRFKKDRNINIQ